MGMRALLKQGAEDVAEQSEKKKLQDHKVDESSLEEGSSGCEDHFVVAIKTILGGLSVHLDDFEDLAAIVGMTIFLT